METSSSLLLETTTKMMLYFYFPDRRVEGQDHLEGSKRPDMYSVRMGTWNLVEILRAMFVILRH